MVTYANKDTYEGEWRANRKHGHGKYTDYLPFDGSRREGEWPRGNNNKLTPDCSIATELEKIINNVLPKHTQLNDQCLRELSNLTAELALSVLQKFEQYRTMGGKNKVGATLQHLLSKSTHLLAFLTHNDREKQRKKEYTRNKRREKCEKAKNLRRRQAAATAAGEGEKH
jgi:hypothetical protein